MKATQEILENLHGVLAEELMARIQSGTALPSDMANAIKFLKDNHIEGLPVIGSPLGNLVESMPFPTKSKLIENYAN
jgi:hypothetical protein